MGGHFLLQRIFPIQGWNPHLLHWQEDSLPAEPPGKLLPGIYGAAYLGQELSKALGSRYHLGVTQRHSQVWACGGRCSPSPAVASAATLR